MQFNIEIIDSCHFVSSEFRRGKPPQFAEFIFWRPVKCPWRKNWENSEENGLWKYWYIFGAENFPRSFAESGESAWSVLYVYLCNTFPLCKEINKDNCSVVPESVLVLGRALHPAKVRPFSFLVASSVLYSGHVE